MTAAHILIVEARFYPELADELVAGAVETLEARGARYERLEVPGALEIPVAIAAAHRSGAYDGFVALGCVIRGETSHYDIVAGESGRAIMDLGIHFGAAIGNGIITVENGDQAWARARRAEKNKGSAAAAACLALVEVRRRFATGADVAR